MPQTKSKKRRQRRARNARRLNEVVEEVAVNKAIHSKRPQENGLVSLNKVIRHAPKAARFIMSNLTKHVWPLIKGFGDYTLNKNSLMGQGPPIVTNAKDRSFIFRHREYISDITATIDFSVNEFTINPSDINTFPWLAQLASSWEQYKFEGLLFEFKTMSSPNVLSASATTALGTVIMATQYDVLDGPFANKREMENYEFASSTVPYKSMIHPVECARKETTLTELYIRDGPLPDSADPRFYDLGKLSIATQGMQADEGVIGELWATYELRLMKPKIPNDAFQTGVDWYNLETIANAVPYGASSSKLSFSNLGTVLDHTEQEIHINNTSSGGVYIYVHRVTGNSTACTNYVVTYTNAAAITGYFDGGVASDLATTSVTVPNYFRLVVFTTTGVNATIASSDSGTLPASASAGDLIVIKLPQQLTYKAKNDFESDAFRRCVMDILENALADKTGNKSFITGSSLAIPNGFEPRVVKTKK